MNNKLTIYTDKFTDSEKYLILQKYPEKKEYLDFYQDARYFQIHKLYYRGFFQGYVILFLGYHSLNTNDVSIEDIGYLRDEELLKPLMHHMLKRIKEHKVLSFPLEEIYYDADKFDATYQEIFDSLQFIEVRREPCRA